MRRNRYGTFVALGFVVLVAVALITTNTSSDGRNSRVNFPPLPSGPIKEPTGHALIGRENREDLLSRAGVVFVGVVTGIGGSEVASPAVEVGDGTNSLVIYRHRVRFLVERALVGDLDARFGDLDAEVDLSLLDLADETTYPFRIGVRYLIFANEKEIGNARYPALIPMGYRQGIFKVDGAGKSYNEVNGPLSVSAAEARLQARG